MHTSCAYNVSFRKWRHRVDRRRTRRCGVASRCRCRVTTSINLTTKSFSTRNRWRHNSSNSSFRLSDVVATCCVESRNTLKHNLKAQQEKSLGTSFEFHKFRRFWIFFSKMKMFLHILCLSTSFCGASQTCSLFHCDTSCVKTLDLKISYCKKIRECL